MQNNRGVLLDAVINRGVQLAVCALGTFTAAYMIAGPAGADAAVFYAELRGVYCRTRTSCLRASSR